MANEELKTDETKYIINLVIKDKLKKEAEEYAKENISEYNNIGAKLYHAYLAGAEPREKRIVDLEKENAELKKWKEDTIKARGNDYMAWSRQNNQLIKAKKILQEYIRINLLSPIERNFEDEVTLFKRAEDFLKENKC